MYYNILILVKKSISVISISLLDYFGILVPPLHVCIYKCTNIALLVLFLVKVMVRRRSTFSAKEVGIISRSVDSLQVMAQLVTGKL